MALGLPGSQPVSDSLPFTSISNSIVSGPPFTRTHFCRDEAINEESDSDGRVHFEVMSISLLASLGLLD